MLQVPEGCPAARTRGRIAAANTDGAPVLFIADSTAIAAPDHPVLAMDLLDDGKRPFRCIPAELWAAESYLKISNMDWAEFTDETDERGCAAVCAHSAPRVPQARGRPPGGN